MNSEVKVGAWLAARIAAAFMFGACQKNETAPTPLTSGTAAFTVTFGENPVPFRTAGCSGLSPAGWYTTARIQETGGVAFTPGTLTQKLDGTAADILNESFASRFGACSGSAFMPGLIAANGAVCGVVGVCTTATYATYQFDVAGADANGRSLTFSSSVLQLAAR
jgi:hypothetical protein